MSAARAICWASLPAGERTALGWRHPQADGLEAPDQFPTLDCDCTCGDQIVTEFRGDVVVIAVKPASRNVVDLGEGV